MDMFLGSGGQAQVFRGMWEGVVVAVKVFTPVLGDATGPSKSLLNIEAEVAASLRHPNVVQFFMHDVVPVTPDGQVAPASEGLVFWRMRITQEYCSTGALREVLDKGQLEGQTGPRTPPSCGTALTLAYDVARGLAYIHDEGIIHGDLKAGNVMLSPRAGSKSEQTDDSANVAKIADFGMAKVVDADKSYVSMNGSVCGTSTHMAPELFKAQQQKPAADVYAYGILMYELMTGNVPWKGKLPHEIFAMVAEGERPVFPSTTPRGVLELAMRCLSGDPAARPSMHGVKQALADELEAQALDPVSGSVASVRIGASQSSLASSTPSADAAYDIQRMQMMGTVPESCD